MLSKATPSGLLSAILSPLNRISRTRCLFSGIILVGFAVIVAMSAGHATRGNAAIHPNFASVEGYGKLALGFERNEGQADPRVKFLARGNGYALFLSEDEATLALREPSKQRRQDQRLGRLSPTDLSRYEVLRVRLSGGQRPTTVSGKEQLPGRANYLIGKDPRKWHTGIPSYSQVRYDNVYPGVNLVYHGSNQRQLEYDFVVAPGADPRQIALRFDGARSLRIDSEGDLTVQLAGGEIIEHAPVIYQEVHGTRRAIAGRYVVKNQRTVAFTLASYDRHRPLVIDPVLAYSTYLGGSGNDGPDNGGGIAVDSSGDAYLTGRTDSTNFPTTPGAFQSTFGGGSSNAYVTKLNPEGTGLVYSTYLGGTGNDGGITIAVDSSGNAYAVGFTSSSDFPTTPGAFQTSLAGSFNAFITKLNANGTALVYSTYLGGSASDFAFGIALDSSGDAYIASGVSSSVLSLK